MPNQSDIKKKLKMREYVLLDEFWHWEITPICKRPVDIKRKGLYDIFKDNINQNNAPHTTI